MIRLEHLLAQVVTECHSVHLFTFNWQTSTSKTTTGKFASKIHAVEGDGCLLSVQCAIFFCVVIHTISAAMTCPSRYLERQSGISHAPDTAQPILA